MGLRCCLVTLRIPHFGGLFPFSAYFSIFFCPLGAYLRASSLRPLFPPCELISSFLAYTEGLK